MSVPRARLASPPKIVISVVVPIIIIIIVIIRQASDQVFGPVG